VEQRGLLAHGIDKTFGRRTVLSGARIEAPPGSVVGLVGENGSGKTTLLRICAGLISPDGGHVDVSGRIGYCPQEPGLIDLLTADEHLRLFGAAQKLDDRDALRWGREILEALRFPIGDPAVAKHLSGGSRQKLNLALSLLGDPEVLLLDEPYQGFDHGTYVDFWDHVESWRALGKAVVVVTHMLAELNRVDEIVELVSVSGAGERAAA
jgi:ABC-2 type transport system ATP-binding protein